MPSRRVVRTAAEPGQRCRVSCGQRSSFAAALASGAARAVMAAEHRAGPLIPHGWVIALPVAPGIWVGCAGSAL